MTNPSSRILKQTVLRLLIVVLAGVLVGLLVNFLSPHGIPLLFQQDQVLSGSIEQVDLDQAKKLFDSGEATFVDSRSIEEFDQGHIKGALVLPDDLFEDKIERFSREADFDRLIVTYCSGEDCMSSVFLAEKLADYGYLEIKVFFGGWPQWHKAGYPTGGPWD